MTSKRSIAAFLLTASALACSTAETPSTEDQSVTAAKTACQTSDECVAIATLPCCSTRKEAFNKAFQNEVEQKAMSLCLVAACAPDFDSPDDRVAACEENECVMVAAPLTPPPEPGAEVAGFDFDGFRIAPLGGDEICPEIVDAVAETCREAGGKASPVKACATVCSVPVAERGKAAGFDFDGFRAAPLAGDEICPEIVDAVAEACFRAGGKSAAVAGCASLCSAPVAERGKVAGYDFTGPTTLPAPAMDVFCPAVVRPEAEACAEARGRTIEASGCRTLCSTPIVDPG